MKSLPTRLRNSAEARPDAEAIVHGDARITYVGLWKGVAGVAGFLAAKGFQKGTRVALLLENSIDYVVAYYGVLSAGGVVVALNTAAKVPDLISWITHSQANWLVAQADHPELPNLLEVIGGEINLAVAGAGGKLTSAKAQATYKFQEMAVHNGQHGEIVQTAPEDLAAIIYTSGTTGRPKGVMLSHENLAENTQSILSYLELDERDSIVNVLPFYYSYGNSVLHTHLAVGAKIILVNSFLYPRVVVEALMRERATGFSGVPSTFNLLLSRVSLRDYDLSCIRYLTQAGGPLAPAVIERVKAELPQARFFVMYGQTEATARLTYLPPEQLANKAGSCGIPIPGVSIEVRGNDDAVVESGEVGEICATGKNIMLGYWKDEEATKSAVRHGWLHTGDLGYKDADGFLFIVGRSSEMIKTGAHRVSPKDIEEAVLELDGIEEVAAVGVPDPLLGQVIKLVVVQGPRMELDKRVILRHCRERLAAYKVPKSVEFATSLPRTASGKIQRYLLQ